MIVVIIDLFKLAVRNIEEMSVIDFRYMIILIA